MFGVRKASKEFAVALREILDENSRLKAENEKLKKAAERDADVLESLNISLEESQAENAKLREYAEWLEDWAFSGFLTKDIEFQIEMKRRELGIGVDE